MNKLSVMIVDDEPLARARLARLLSEDVNLKIVGEYAEGHSALAAIASRRPDVVFLDIQMPEPNGLEVIRRLSAYPDLVFVLVTAFPEHAVDAYGLNVADYLLKPVYRGRIDQTIERVRQRVAEKRSHAAVGSIFGGAQALAEELQRRTENLPGNPESSMLTRIRVKTGSRFHIVSFDNVDYIEAAGNYVRLHEGKLTHIMRCTLKQIEGRLDVRRFRRVHRFAIVNMDRVEELIPGRSGDYAIRLQTGVVIRASRTYRTVLTEMFGDSICRRC